MHIYACYTALQRCLVKKCLTGNLLGVLFKLYLQNISAQLACPTNEFFSLHSHDESSLYVLL